ncbi:MAG: hypothetical protein ACXABY_18985 [Candidatus Thorarchaeota archaeon]|jgi:hypothetical protein
MGRDFRHNWKRLGDKILPKTPTASAPNDMVRVEDLNLLAGSGVYRVTNLFGPTPGFAPGSGETVFELVVIRVSGNYDVVLPNNPIRGKRYEIKDGVGDGCVPGVTKQILPSGSDTIEDIFTSFPLSNCYQSWSLIYDGSGIWRLV